MDRQTDRHFINLREKFTFYCNLAGEKQSREEACKVTTTIKDTKKKVTIYIKSDQ